MMNSIYSYEWDEVYKKRQIRLKASDWTQLPDSPLSEAKKAEWATYRQALRDVPELWDNLGVPKEEINPLETPNIFPQKPS